MKTEDFIKKAIQIHGDKYDYSLVDYKNCDTKVKIFCKKHNFIFEQTPYCHNNMKQGCPKCGHENGANKIRKTSEQYAQEANSIHHNKYDYSLVDYKNTHTKIKIICPIHGIFKQDPASHLNGCGCSKCSNKYKYSPSEWIELAKTIHKNKYDYSETIYDGYYKKVKIKCIKHNCLFETFPYSHIYLQGGCPLCKKEKVSESLKMPEKEFIEICKIIHNNEYDYSVTKYNGNAFPIKYICKKHGEIEQIANYHISGAGCPFCKSSKGEKRITEFLKSNKIKFKHQMKYDDLKDKDLLSYDFYLYDYNLLIEFNGEQHYHYASYFHKNLHDFHRQLHHDWLKRKYAKKNNIRLLTIPYSELYNIEKILEENINEKL